MVSRKQYVVEQKGFAGPQVIEEYLNMWAEKGYKLVFFQNIKSYHYLCVFGAYN